MNKRFLISILASFFIGCGGNDSNNDQTTSNISGIVVDGYIKDAKVCIDLNKNLKCDSDEESSMTDKNGSYNITANNIKNNQLVIASSGFDIEREEEFNSTLIGVIKNKKAILTPITTFNYFYALNNNQSFEEVKKEVANILDITESDIEKDPIKNSELKEISLKLELIVEIATILTNKNTIDIFDKLSINSLIDNNLSSIIDASFDDSNIKTSLYYISSKVEKEYNISNLKNIKKLVINTTLNAKKNDILLTNEILDNNANSIYALVKAILDNLKYTSYRHYREGFVISKDTLLIDCSGFVDYIIESLNPYLYSKMFQESTYSCYNVKAADYVNFAKNKTFKEFNVISSVKDIQKGDIVAYKLNDGVEEVKCNNKTVYLTECIEYKDNKCIKRENTGHVFIAIDTPKKQNDKWILKVADSTTYLHQNDSRSNTETKSGVGYGDIFLYENYILIKGNKIPIYILRMR